MGLGATAPRTTSLAMYKCALPFWENVEMLAGWGASDAVLSERAANGSGGQDVKQLARHTAGERTVCVVSMYADDAIFPDAF